MIYLFTGSDVNRTRAKAFQWVAAARAKAPDAYYSRLSAEQVSEAALREALQTQGLFFSRTLIMLDDPFSSRESAEVVLEMLSELKDSANVVAILAPKLLTARLKKVEAVAEKVFVVDAPNKVERGFNSALVNALAAKDGATLWKEIVLAYRNGDAPEMIHGLLHWKARDLMQKGSRAWNPEEARKLSRDLILLLSDSRGKDLPLDMALERFALSLSA
jgi:DNA polymerase III delta subunit